MKFIRLLFLTLSVLTASIALSQQDYAKWSAKPESTSVRAGENTRILITAEVTKGWHIYAMKEVQDGPIPTSFTLSENPMIQVAGPAIEPTPIVKLDPNFNLELGLLSDKPVFALPVKISPDAKGEIKFKITVRSQACNENTCDIPKSNEIDITLKIEEGTARADRLALDTSVPDQPAQVDHTPKEGSSQQGDTQDDFTKQVNDAQDKGLFAFILLSFGLGLLALLTPCVFPMIPITVSFFSKTPTGEKKSNFSGAMAYCLGIIGTFTALGIGVTLAFGATGVQDLATNPWVNGALFLVFIALALSLFGLFEIQIPSALLTKLSSNPKRTGFVGPLLMGLTFTLTSFTCTVPIVGTLLAGATQGNLMYPIIGMLAFSTAFALPFFFLALFPQYLSKLPKSGSWLAQVKIFMGYIELAAAVKFLSNIDLVYQWGILKQTPFLAIWAVLMLLAGLQLLGALKMGGPSKVGWGRRVVGALSILAAGYCIMGIKGAPMGELAAFLPPDPYPGTPEAGWSEDIAATTTLAKETKKPIFIDFTGVTCTNCRWMEKNMFPLKDVEQELNGFVKAKLYTDRTIESDRKNQELQKKLTGVTTLPVYVIVDHDQNVLKVFQGSTRSKEEFIKFLQEGKSKFK